MKVRFATPLIFLSAMLQAIPAATPESDPLSIPDSDEDVPGAGPIRRTDWFRGVWRSRRSSWLDKTEAQKGSVVFLGDSITEGWGDDFKGAFGDLKVANRGIRGDTSRGLLLRLEEDVIALEPRAVAIMIGANDLAEKAKGDTVFGNVKLIVEALKKHNPEMPIVLCETFPCAPDDYRPAVEIRKINALYEQAYAGDTQVMIAKTYGLFAGGDGASLPKLFPDRVHPNAAGYAKWAGAMRAIFAELGFAEDTTPDPIAWIHFGRHDRQVALFNNFYIYYTDRDEPLEFTIDVPPHTGHKLAIQWITKHGPERSMRVELNGEERVIRHPSEGDGRQSFFWDTRPVTDFGVLKNQAEGNYHLKITCPDDAEDDAVITGIRLITDEAQLDKLALPQTKHKATFVAPGSLSEAEVSARKIDLEVAKRRVRANWVGKNPAKQDEFLAAAAKFGDTAIKHGRDVYGAKHTPMFVRFLNREKLRAPRSIASMPPALGGADKPIIQTQWDRTQNLLRTLVGLSQATGDPKYADAAMEATAHMFEEYSMPHSGLLVFGNHMTIDLLDDRGYSDGRSGDIFELEVAFPFYDFWHDVSPTKTDRFIKGCWEVYVRDWHTMHYNRHAGFNKNIDFTRTFERPMTPVENLPTKMEVLGFIDVGLDLAFGAYSLGCLTEDENARLWANRFYQVLAYHRDPKTQIWPTLLYTPSIRRNLEVYREAFPAADATEPRVIISSWIFSQPKFWLGALDSVEQAHRFLKAELFEPHKRIDEWILGYLEAAYRPESNTLRSIIIDGTDVTDHVFQPGKVLHGWGAKEGDSFNAHAPSATFHAAVARAYRLTHAHNRKRFWPHLRALFKGAGLGDIGADPKSRPAFDFEFEQAEPAYILALADLYRAHRQPEVLKMMEHLGRQLIARRQDPASGLFSHHPDKIQGIRHNARTKESWEEQTVSEILRREFDYDRPTVVALDVVEPLALLAIHACRTDQFEKIPQWLGGGQWGSDGSGHVISSDLERWFDREKLEAYYENQRLPLKQKGYEIGEGWFPQDN